MATIDAAKLATDIKDAASQILNNDISALKGFSERQVTAISQHAALVAGGIASGQITEETREFFLENIERMTESFLATLQGLLMITIEKLWNAVVSVIWNTINVAISATGIVLPVPVKT